MCGRYILVTDLSVIVESFDIQETAADYRAGNNISPGQEIMAVIHEDKIRLVRFRWGLIPPWGKDPSIGYKMINARAETIAEKPSFRDAFKSRRCLIPADGFYEWQKSGTVKKPYRFYLKSGEPFGFAGLYETWVSPENDLIRTCAIITTGANGLMLPIHNRMPAIVPKEREATWLDPENHDQKGLLAMLKAYPANEMAMSEADSKHLATPGGAARDSASRPVKRQHDTVGLF